MFVSLEERDFSVSQPLGGREGGRPAAVRADRLPAPSRAPKEGSEAATERSEKTIWS